MRPKCEPCSLSFLPVTAWDEAQCVVRGEARRGHGRGGGGMTTMTTVGGGGGGVDVCGVTCLKACTGFGKTKKDGEGGRVRGAEG